MNVTPALLSTTVLEAVQRRLEAVGGRPWMDVLLTSYCDWTEYTLYLLAAEDLGLVARDHLWADDPASPAHLHVDPRRSVWSDAGASRADLARLFDAADPGLFAVVQSSSGLSAAEVAAAVADRFEIRHTDLGPAPAVESASRLGERVRIASRLAAQGTYRARRGLRRLAPR